MDRTRRRFLRLLGTAAAALPAGAAVLLPPAATGAAGELDEAAPAAVALGYRRDTTQVDEARYPQHAAAQVCSGCRYYLGKPGSESGPCTLFAGQGAVRAKGWCAAYAARA